MGRKKADFFFLFELKVCSIQATLICMSFWRQRAVGKLGSSFFFLFWFDAVVLRIWVYMKNVRVPNLKASPWSQSEWSASREEKRGRGRDAVWRRRPRGPARLEFCSAQVVWDHASQRLFISYCHGWDGRAAASHTFKRPVLLVEGLDWVSVGKSESGRRLITQQVPLLSP